MRKIGLGCPKQIKITIIGTSVFIRVAYKEEANLWSGSLGPTQLMNDKKRLHWASPGGLDSKQVVPPSRYFTENSR